MNYKKFTYYFVAFAIIMLGIIIGINYFFDFYAVFNQNREVYYGSINDRYAKVSYILKNKERYNTFIWGSSRTQKMDSSILSYNTYNMAATSGGPEDCLRELKIFLDNSIKINTIYLGVDNFSYKYNHLKEIQTFYTIPYSENFIDNIKYLTKVALKKPDKDRMKIYINGMEKNDKSVINYLGTTGKLAVPKFVEDNINKTSYEYVYDKKFDEPLYTDDKNEHIDYTISIIREIKKLCDDNKINFIVFFNPVHITSYLEDDINISNQFKRELVKITNFYDFNYINFVMLNNYFWYETSHPRYFVCDWELKVITNQYDKNIPEDFGHLITKENIDYYCNKYIIDRENFKKPSKQYIPEEPII